MRIKLLAALAFCVLPACANAAITVTIDKSAQLMTVEQDGRALYQWPVSTGKAGYDTPNGKFKAFRLEKDHFSKEWDDAPMPFSIFFTQKGHAIHGSFDTKRLGSPASHGCVRLLPANAEKLFDLVKADGVLNTTVILTGVAPSGAPAVARRQSPRQEDLNAYTQPSQQQQLPRPGYYGQQQVYGQQPVYGQQQPQQYYAQPQYQYREPTPYYVQPQYGPYQQRGYVYRDPYADPYQPRRGTIFP